MIAPRPAQFSRATHWSTVRLITLNITIICSRLGLSPPNLRKIRVNSVNSNWNQEGTPREINTFLGVAYHMYSYPVSTSNLLPQKYSIPIPRLPSRINFREQLFHILINPVTPPSIPLLVRKLDCISTFPF